jgi:hypothetical protein
MYLDLFHTGHGYGEFTQSLNTKYGKNVFPLLETKQGRLVPCPFTADCSQLCLLAEGTTTTETQATSFTYNHSSIYAV